jgi:hypothetical protein
MLNFIKKVMVVGLVVVGLSSVVSADYTKDGDKYSGYTQAVYTGHMKVLDIVVYDKNYKDITDDTDTSAKVVKRFRNRVYDEAGRLLFDMKPFTMYFYDYGTNKDIIAAGIRERGSFRAVSRIMEPTAYDAKNKYWMTINKNRTFVIQILKGKTVLTFMDTDGENIVIVKYVGKLLKM